MNLNIGFSENDYELQIEGQSHGFCNIFVKHLLSIEGVNMAAYKYTRIDPAQIFIRLEPGYKIKEIIQQGIESLREEVLDVQKIFKKLT
ncbi:MAG: RpoL/Rpb11 RNA polymerase subunit family protein [Promethearchaeota archaeon]